MTYGYYGAKGSRKQSKTKTLEVRRILASLAMTAGLLVYPFSVGEAAIVRRDETTISPTNNVYNIDPEGKNSTGDFAYNRFKEFGLEQGQIANLKFGNASTLANLVNSKVTINGIVNAVKGNAIDGHLIFLSPNGIAVGSSGIINAGQFTGIVPTEAAFNKLYYNETGNPADVITQAAIDQIIKDGAYAAVQTDAEGGKTGVIDISGKINTHSGVMLGAGIINIKDGAQIQSTKNLEFTNLVNIKNEDTIVTNAGLGELTKVEGSGGEIVLAAKQVSDVKDTKVTKDANGQDKTEANPIRWKDRSTDLNAAVNIGKDGTNVSITSSDGAVKITAENSSTYEDSTPMTLTDTLKNVIFGQGETIIDGLVDKLAGKEAAANKYVFVNYSNKKNKASVNVGEKSNIMGNSIDITATSNVEIKQSVALSAVDGKKDSKGKEVGKDSNGQTAEGSKVVAAVAVSRVFNNADIVIDGKLTATGADENGSGIRIAANADTKASLSATGNGGAGNAVAVGVEVLTGDTKSKVTVKEGTTPLSAANGKVSIEATTKSDVDVTVNAVGNTSYVSSNVGVANYDTSADVILNRSITAGAVDVKAENNITGMKMTVDNAAPSSGSESGKDTPETTKAEKQQDDADATEEQSKKSEDEKKSEQNSIDPTKILKDSFVDTNDDKAKDATGSDGKGGIQDVKDKLEGTNEGGDNGKKNSAFGLGAAVGVVSNTNNANVTIGKNVVITATPIENSETANGAVNVSANTLMQASAEKEDGFQFSVKNTQSGANVEIGAAVLVSNVKNDATVLMDSDSDGTKFAQIKGGKVSLDAGAGMGKYKVNQPKTGEDGKPTGETEEVEKTSVLKYTVSAEGTAEDDKPSKFVLDGSVGVNTLKNNAIVLLGQHLGRQSQVEGSEVKLSSDATTNAEGTYGAKDENTKVGLGGTVGIQNIRGNSLVMVGKGASITGTDSFEASAENSMDLKNTVQNAGKGTSIGISGMLALSYGESNSVVSIDDEANITTGFATITSTNSTNIENVARSESAGQDGAKAFGIGVGIVNYDVNSIAMVGDNGSGIIAPTGSNTDTEKAAKKIYADAALARTIAGDTLAGKLGGKTTGDAKGNITTGGLVGMALTTGMIQNDAKAKVVTSSEDDGDENDREDSEKWTKWSKKGEEGSTDAKQTTNDLEQDNVESQNGSAPPAGGSSQKNNATSAMGEASEAANPDGSTNAEDEGAAPAAGSEASAGASIGIEGSVALTFLGGRTDAVLDNVIVKNETVTPAPVLAVSMSATDFLGSITMGGTSVKHSVQESASANVGIGGTFAMNSVSRDVDSLIRNSELPMALMVSNSATKIGIEVAAGMGVSTAEGTGANINGAGVVYYNKAKQDVHALMINTNVMGASVSNEATSTDFQIAGGLAATKGGGAGTNVGVGGAVAISKLENDLKSGIIGGEYTVLSTVDVAAEKGTTQVNGALAGTKGGYGFEGAFAYGSAKNTTRAYIENATVTSLGDVNVKAGEVPVVRTDAQKDAKINEEKSKIDEKITKANNKLDNDKKLTDEQKAKLKEQANKAIEKEAAQQKSNKDTLDAAGLDTTGESYLDKSSAASSLDDDVQNTDEGKIAGDAAKDEDDAKDDLSKNHSLTITAAMGGGWNDNVGAGAGIAYNYVKNDIAADIKGSTITANAVTGQASSDATIVSVGAGVAIGGKTFNGAGSGSWNDLKNDTKVNFEGNTITGKSILEGAENAASIINIAGELVGGKGMAMGLSLAYNSLNNTTGAYLKNNALTLQSESDAPGEVVLATANTGKALAVAGGVNVNISGSYVGATGTVAINRGVNHTESVIDNAYNTIDGVKALSVTASDLTKKTTVAGGISVGGKKVGMGGSVAYTSVGSSSDKERLRAEVNHANITTTADGTITVSTTDNKKNANNEVEKSRVITVGAGFGVDWGKNFFNLQGGAAVSDIYKDSRASLNNTNINAQNKDAHPTINVTADTKSKINTVGVGGSVSIGSQVKGAAGVAINRMYQDTKAEMATDSGTTTVNAGLTQVRATGDGDIHSVGVGGLVGVGGQIAFAGSGSYNYIGNNVNAILKNQKLTANRSVGVVAQSDDRLYNFSGGFAIGANTKVGLGASVSINKITGDTNALVSGGSVSAADVGNITVTRPKDDDLFKAEKLDVSTNQQKLSENRQSETKTGVVVDSSATHTMISQLSSGGVAISGSLGVNVDGTVNLNTIKGETTAKIQDTDLNSDSNASDVNVNAIDYSNLGTFTGTPSIGGGGVGVSVGVSANWETLDRMTAAEISFSSASKESNVYAKNLTVDATAKHGSSALSFAAAGAAGKVSVSSGDSIMRHKYTNKTLATVSNVNAVYDGAAEIKADHLGNSHTENVSVSASIGMVAVAAGAGVSVMDDSSTVKAEVKNSKLKEKEKSTGETDKKTISVWANNKNNWNNTLVTASLGAGIGAGVAANVGIYNITGETAALVTNSDLKATDVTVKATDELTAKGTGGVGAGGVGGVGVAVTLNNINRSVSSHVTGGQVEASNDINVATEEMRSFDCQVTGVGAGGIGVGVNVAVTSINKGITDAQLSNAKDENNNPTSVNADTQNEIKKHLNSVNGAKGTLGSGTGAFLGLKEADKKDIDDTVNNMSVSLATPTYDSATPDTKKMGVHTEVSNVILTAGNDVNVTAKDTSDIFAKNVGVTAAGAASINVTDAIIHTNYDTDVTMSKATVTGKNVNINALQTQAAPKDGKQGSDVRVTAVTVGALASVGVGYAGIVNRGATDVNIADSKITSTAGNVAVNATDESKHQSQILSVGVAALNVTTTFASVENYSNVGVTLAGTNNISATKAADDKTSDTGNITIDAKKANALEAHTQGVGVGGVNVAVNHATIEDGGKDGDRITGNVTAKITGTTNIMGKDEESSAEKFHLGATNDTTAKLSAGNVAVSVLGISRMRGKGVMDMGADVSVAGGAFNAKTVEFASTLGNANGRTIEGNVKGHNISVGAVAPDAVILNTDAKGSVTVANSTFGENTDLILDNESYVDRKAYIYDVTVGGVAVGNSSADIVGNETLTTTLTGKAGITNKLNSLQVAAYGENTGKALADAGGGGLVGYVGAHVDNKSTNTVNSTLSGKWDVQGEVYLAAAQKDETRLTASEGHGGVIGVGGTSVDNTIRTTTNATVENGTEITADQVHVGTGNSITTGAYDDTDGKGNKDVQAYTLKDHFGGVISGNRLRSLLDVKETGTVTIGENAKITTNKLQEYIAASENDLVNHASAKGGGAVAITDTVTENKLTINNTVNVKNGASLSNEKAASTEDIILSAYDEHKLNSHADATVGGVAGVLVSKNETTMDRTSNINVAGTIESGSNVGLYAGANKDGVLSNLNVDLKAGVYNYTAIPISSPTVNYNNKADNGLVDVSGTVRSTRDINAIASGGKESVVTDESKWAWVNGGKEINKKFLSSNAVVAEEAMPKTSIVNVTGALIAGTAAPINVTIGGAVATGLTIEADNNQANLRVKNGITEGTFDYANTLGARYKELNELISAYDGDATKMAAYIAERDRIKNKMKDLNLLVMDDNGNVTAYNTSLPIYFVEIPDIATSGGNINVTANEFIGTGKLHANSAPSVKITNESDAYLKINNIIMGEKGGQIIYNQDHVIHPPAATGNAEINEINVNKNGAEFSEIGGRTDDTEAAGLEVLNTRTFSGADGKTSTVQLKDKIKEKIDSDTELTDAEKEEYKQAISKGEVKYTAITDVEVNGKVSNFYGNVTIKNASGDIRISGGTTARPTGVEGNSVSLIAANGTIAQDYKEGIVNIDGEPERYFEKQANESKEALHLSETSSESGWRRYENPQRSFSQTPTGYIAGRDVYVSAANINVNGLIQSGYKNYAATVTDAQVNAAKARPADRAAVVQNRTMYKVNDGGAQWNSTEKVFDYVPQVYWDPSTDKLVVEDIDTAGGKVYLTGMIASTGTGTYSEDKKLIPGRILAADGAAEISVINNTTLDMNMGNVLNNQRQGIITIADTAKDTWTEYRRGQTRTINNYAAYLKRHREAGDPYARAIMDQDNDASIESNNGFSVGHDLTYNVKDKQTYSWVNGNTVDTNRTFEHYERRGFWGLVQTANETQLKEWEKNSAPVSIDDKKKYGLPEGAVISQNSNVYVLPEGVPEDNKYMRVDGSTTVLSSKITDRTHDQWSSGFLGWFKHTRDRWKVGTKTIQLYNYTLDASKPITIGLIGSEKGSINIESTNDKGGSINLTGNVANSHNEATLNISSKAGGITQFDNTTLKSEIVTLSAKDDIKNIHITSIGAKDAGGKITDNVQLNAVSAGKGDIDITVVGGELGGSLPGNVTILALKSKGGSDDIKNAELGDVTLNAAGNITQSGDGTTVEGRGITLTSKNGGIGTDGQAIEIAGSDLVYSTDRYGAQVNASAKNSIYLTETESGGDMRVGKIESREGDVNLTVVNGGFIDGLPADDKSGSTDSVDEMVHRWIDAGLIDGEKDGSGNYTYKGAYIEGLEKARDDYKANVEAAYENYKANVATANEVKNVYASADYQNYLNKTGDYADKTDEEILAKLVADEHLKYVDYKKYATAAEYLAANNMDWEAQYNTQKAATEAVYASADYKAYVAGTGAYAGMTDAQKAAKLAADGHQAYVTYAKYGSAEAYMQDSATYKYTQFSKYENAGAYLDKDETYKELKTKAENPKFEWTKNMMLYAVSEALVNKASGETTQTKRAANVLGKNVTLTSTQGAVGTVEGTATTITAEELQKDITKMKALMNVDASDVEIKWSGDDKDKTLESFTIKRNLPLGVKASGTLDVQAGGDVSVAGRTDKAGEHSAINVGTVNATNNNAQGDVRLYSAKGIYNDLKTDDDNQTNITGKNLLLVGGEEKVSVDGDERASIGTSDKPLTVSLTGDLTEARASENVYIKNMKQNDVLRLGAMYAGNTISLNSDKGFKMRDAYNPNPDKNIAQSYINAGKKLEFVTNTDITGGSIVGEIIDGNDYSIRILNDRAPVDITATDAHIRGVGSLAYGVQNGTLVLGTINTTNEFVAESEGSLSVGQEEEKDSAGNVVKPAVEGKITAGGNTTLSAADNLTLDGTVTAGDLENAKRTLTLKAVNGDITQTAKGAIAADAVNTFNGKSLLLENANNQFNSITVDGIETEPGKAIDGDVRIIDNSDALTVAVKREVTGDISVENFRENGALTNSGNLTATGNIELEAKGDLTQAAGTTLDAGKDVNLTSTNGALTANGNIKAQENIDLKAKGDLTQAAGSTLDAGKDVNLTSTNGALTANGNIKAQENIDLKAKGDLTQAAGSTLDAGKDVNLTSTNGALTANGNIKAQENIILKAKGDLTQAAGSTLDARMNVEMTSTNGNLTQAANTEIKAGQNVTQTAQNGALVNDGKIVSLDGGITLIAKGDLTQGAKLRADKDIKVTSENGALANNNSIISGNGNIVLKAEKDLTQGLKGILAANNREKEVQLTSVNGGITQQATEEESAGIQAKKVTVVSKNGVDLWGVNNYFDAITVQSSVTNAPIQGSVSIFDCADNMELSILPFVNGNIKVENRESAGAIHVTSELHANGNGADAKGDITLQSKGNIVTERKLTAANDVTATSTDGAMTIGGDVSASNNITLTSKEIMQTTGKLTAANNVTATSTDGAMTIGGDVSASNNITLTSKETMQTTGKLTAVNNVTATSTNGAMTIGGDVTTTTGDIKLQSNGNMQTTGKLTAKQNANSDNPAGNVNLTSTAGNVTVGGDVTTGTTSPELVDSDKDGIPELKGIYNSLTIHAGGAIQETDGVKIDTPVVETYSGKGVSLESAKNTFGVFLADGVDGKKVIDGSVKVATNYEDDDDSVVTVGLGASVNGDAEFSNLNPKGGLGILVWHPDDKNRNISILGGNGAKGDLVLKASQDVGLLGDAYAVHDVVVKSTNGSFYGIGRSITAENDVNVSVADSVYYIGGTGKALYAGHDIIIEATNPASDDAGIYIGALPDNINLMDVMNGTASVEEAPTKLWAGNNANFNVNGNGDIDLEGDVIAEAGKVSATVAGKGDITVGNEEGVAETTIMAQKDVTLKTEEGNIKVSKGIQSTEESVSVQTGKGDITVGRDNVVDGKTITAKKDVSVGTDLGTIYIQGETSTETGDITMKAGKDKYEVGSDSGNFVIRDDGQVNSGGSVTLNGRNGDIHITDDIKAKKGLTASITEQGNVYFDTNVSVTNDVNITTDKGKIDVGHTVNAETGTVKMQTRDGDISIGADVTAGSDVDMKTAIKGDITVGADVTAGNDVTMNVNNGDVTVGVNVTGDDASSSGQGNVVAKNGDVTVDISGKGNVGITKSVDSQNGSVSVKTKEGNINIGSANVKDDKTVTAKENVNVETDLGTIYILGMTSTENGDITMKAGKDSYQADEGSGEDLVQNGNFIIKDDGKVNSGGAVNLKGRNGDIHITDAIEAKKGITTNITEKGNVYFDREVNVKDDVNITTEDGSIAIGKTVTSTEGNVNLQTGTGSILIGQDVTAEKDITITTKEGSVIVGDTDTGGDGDVLSKKGDVSIQTGEGVVGIVKSVKAQEGSIDIQVGTGGVAIGNNGPGVETVTAYKNIDVAVDLGRIEINGKTSTKKGDISMSAAESEYVPGGQNIIIAQNGELDSGRDARLTGRNGDLHVTDAVKAVRNLNAKVLDEGDIVYDKTVNVNGDVTAKTDKGSISVAKEVTGNLVDLDTGKGNITVSGDIRSNTDVTMHTGTGDISVKNINAQGNTTISDTGRGNVNGNNIVSGGTTHVSLTKGDLFLNLAEGKAVVLRMEDNTKASKVGTVLADASGGAGPDVELTGNYIPIGTLAAKNGNAVFEVTAMGANNQKLISGEITVGSLRSRTNTHMPTLWANRGNIHVDEGDLAIDDVLAVDKIHLENKLTDLAIFGRTPTRDGEQLYYWNNLEMANSKTRPFTLYANGKVRTHRAVLIDAGRYYGKLYGDNLSVVDMMRERLTNEHGQYTFDRTWYTKPGEVLREKVLFGMDTVDEDIRRHNASSGQLM